MVPPAAYYPPLPSPYLFLQTNLLSLPNLLYPNPANPPASSDIPTIITIVTTISRLLLLIIDSESRCSSSRWAKVVPYLEYMKPSLEMTLEDLAEIEDVRSKGKRGIWKVLRGMEEEAEISMVGRMGIYQRYLEGVLDIIARPDSRISSDFIIADEDLRKLRTRQRLDVPAIKPPSHPPSTRSRAEIHTAEARQGVHWLQRLFNHLPPTTHRFLISTHSTVNDPEASFINPIPPNSPTLLNRDFNNHHLNIKIYLHAYTGRPYIIASENPGYPHPHTQTTYSQSDVTQLIFTRGILHRRSTNTYEPSHELVISRLVPSCHRDRLHRIEWLVLSMDTWEDLVLLWTALHTLKAQLGIPKLMTKHEFELTGETLLGTVQIVEKRETRALLMLEDKVTGGRRLQCVVNEGDMQMCTVWTGFISGLWRKKGWLRRVDEKTVLIFGLQIHVFKTGFRGKRDEEWGAFRVRFLNSKNMFQFMDIFDMPDESSSSS